MHKWCCANLVALAAMTLTGCATQPYSKSVSPAQAVALARTGQPLLHCRDECLAAWQHAAPQAAQLDAAARWADLAALVESIDYQDDLSLYYLGRAAEGIGYPGAAASYYRQSTYLSGTTIACRSLSRTCGGLDLPRAALVRLAAIERQFNPPRSPRARAVVPQPIAPAAVPRAPFAPAPASAPGAPGAPEAAAIAPPPPPPTAPPLMPAPEAAAPLPAVGMPPPPAVPPAPASPPAPGRAVQPSSDFIEPPPAVH